MLVEPLALLVPPNAGHAAVEVALVFLAVWVLESLLYTRLFRLPLRDGLTANLETYTPLAVLWGSVLLFIPGLPLVPTIAWWLVLDAAPWLVTLVVACVVWRKVAFIGERASVVIEWEAIVRWRVTTLVLALALVALVASLTPSRRFTQPYDERWGTGDEPRYVRMTASLLHDGDANIENAEELIGRRAEPLEFLFHVLGWIPASFRTAGEAVSSLLGSEPAGSATWLGGPVIEGRKGGTYYVFLPGLPLLLVPLMAIDSWLHPERLTLTLYTCLVLGVVLTLLLARLVEPLIGSRVRACGLAVAMSLTLPLFFYHFQIYTEVPAAVCLTAMLLVLFSTRLTRSGLLAFAVAGAFLPWLHAKYLPIWGISVLALAWKGWQEKADFRQVGFALSVACVGLGLYCLYGFHITGSLMPDAIWVTRGYAREATVASASTLPGLYYTLVDRAEGFLVYAPMYVLAVPGALALGRRSRFAFVLSLAIAVPYLLVAASHDQGGAGAWSPTTRYMVPLLPVFALFLAAWLGDAGDRTLRWTALAIAAAGSFSLLLLWERRGWSMTPVRVWVAALALILVAGSSAALWSGPEEWIHRRGKGSTRVRGSRAVALELPDCGAYAPRLRLQGTGVEHDVTVRGPGFQRALRVPSTRATSLEVSVAPVLRFARSAREAVRVVTVRLDAEQQPVDVQAVCAGALR